MKKMKTKIKKYRCEYCGDVFAEMSLEYIQANPNASEMHLERLRLEHEMRCSEIEDDVIVCEKCGEIICTFSPAYAILHPYDAELYVESQRKRHERWCNYIPETSYNSTKRRVYNPDGSRIRK
jgi:hypothetical protein